MSDAIVQRILASPKYRHLDPDFVARVVVTATRARSGRAAEKEARRRLHQAVGAFTSGRPVAAVERARRAVEADQSAAPAVWRRAMRAHRSTAERADHLAEVGALLEAWCGRPRTVVDLAGGLGVLAVPWLELARGAVYTTVDVHVDLAQVLGSLGPLLGVEVIARVDDLAAPDPPRMHADLGLLLKAVPTLDALRPGAGRDVITALTCTDLVVSFPLRSLGGRRRFTVGTLDRAAAAVDGTPYAVADDRVVGAEHYVLCRPRSAL